MRYVLALLFILHPTLVFAEEISNECVAAIRDLYRFYYHEVSPNPKSEACKNAAPEKLDQHSLVEMQIIISELKTNCSKNLIAQINHSISTETPRE